ncbi:MAG TPA: HAMP domain-containing sensor histidine kinase [Mucilaginibacter sp.]|nr:HAMP domain-containing sensor histidine kinase [Mucilaginibacter sp.]
MKRKLNVIFLLVMLSLTGIIMFQVYWTVNAYHVNKNKFDADIDIAMQKAMDDCKKDYFDSIRVVLVKRLSLPETTIKIDTLEERDHSNAILHIYFSNLYTKIYDPFTITKSELTSYRKKINHTATTPEVITEASFYIPALSNNITLLLGMYDVSSHGIMNTKLDMETKSHLLIPRDSGNKPKVNIRNTIYEYPKNVLQADSLKLRSYLTRHLSNIHINSPFTLQFSLQNSRAGKLNSHYSETAEYSYKYHGFKLFHIVGPEYFARAVFRNPQYAIIKGMTITLVLSILLIALAIYCFNYIIKTILEQKKLAELKDDFINNMTHELKTPIATITVAIEGLQKFNALNDPEKAQRYLQTSKNELIRLNDLVTKVLNVAAYENKNVELVKEPVNVDELINDIIISEKVKSDKKVNFTYTNKDNIQTITVDKLHFQNMLVNLVDNAVKYAKEPVDVVINCYKSGNQVCFAVKDSGPGIPAAHLGQIFDKFYRVPTGNLHNVKGTGLGLSYVKYIAEAHGGNVSVKSEINTGSEFIVCIPLSNG